MKGNMFTVSKNIEIIPEDQDRWTLYVHRLSSGEESTIGALFLRKGSGNLEFLCFTLEDEFRDVKVNGETRIPAGEYRIGIRAEGGFHSKYISRFGIPFHKGMLQVMNVPNFEYILIHCGNTDDDTAGCLLVGDGCIQNVTTEGLLSSSVNAYRRIYPELVNHVLEGKPLKIIYIDVA